jgi:hypothetical protein
LSRSLYKKVGIKRLILALVIVLIAGVGGLVYIGIIGLKGFYIGAFRQELVVEI